MGIRARQAAAGAALAWFVSSSVPAAANPAFRILYHESIRPQTQLRSGHTRGMSFDAYGRHFDLVLQPNNALAQAIPADRSDIETLRGQVDGQPGSWVRMTHTRSGWHGMVSDGQELYAIEPAAAVADAVVQPLAGQSGSVMYRLKDALLPLGPQACQVLNPDGSIHTGAEAALPSPAGDSAPRMTAKMLFDSIVQDAAMGQVAFPDLKLTVGVVADYEFYQEFSSDPEGTILSRMDIVDGIWSSQVGVKIALAPLTIFKSPDEPFTKTAPVDLLSQLRQYRGSHTAQQETGVTHLMTGRSLDADIVGIAYMGSVCDSQAADSLSEGNHSTLMSALIAAHEIGHNFNAPHDGAAGACSTTPQTFLMAPKLNFSEQFSSCSLDQINARIKTARCLRPYTAPDVAVEVPAGSAEDVENSAFTVSFVARATGDDASNDVSARATLPTNLLLRSATAAGGTCSIDAAGGSATSASVTCSLGKMTSQESRQIDLTVVGNAVGNGTATVSVASSNDAVATNDSAQISIQISASAPSTAPVTTSSAGANAAPSAGGSGGGGSLDLMLLGVLGGVAARARIYWSRRGQ